MKKFIKWSVIAGGVLLVLGIIGALVGPKKDELDTVSTADTTSTSSSPAPARSEASSTSSSSVSDVGLGVSLAEAKAGLESLTWIETKTGWGSSNKGATIALNGTEDAIESAAIYIDIQSDIAAAQGLVLGRLLTNLVGERAMKTIIEDWTAKASGRERGTEGKFSVGDKNVEFAIDRKQARTLFIVNRPK